MRRSNIVTRGNVLKQNVGHLQTATERYYFDHDAYPISMRELFEKGYLSDGLNGYRNPMGELLKTGHLKELPEIPDRYSPEDVFHLEKGIWSFGASQLKMHGPQSASTRIFDAIRRFVSLRVARLIAWILLNATLTTVGLICLQTLCDPKPKAARNVESVAVHQPSPRLGRRFGRFVGIVMLLTLFEWQMGVLPRPRKLDAMEAAHLMRDGTNHLAHVQWAADQFKARYCEPLSLNDLVDEGLLPLNSPYAVPGAKCQVDRKTGWVSDVTP